MKILVAVDGSKYTKRMLAYLAAHDEWLGAQHAYTLVTVVPPVPPRAAAVLPKDVLAAHYDAEAERVFKPVRQFLAKKALTVEYVSKTGPAAETIAALADKGKFHLLMMGSHGHGAFGNLVLGSVATKVMAQCKAPVLLVR
jgi:nucleotide-binding universal stress UspA family protein